MCDNYLLNRAEFSQGIESPSSRLSDVATRFLSGPPLTCCFCCQERRSLAAQIQLKQTKAPLLWAFNLDSIKETKELGEKIEITWTTSCTFSPADPSRDAQSQTGPLSASSNSDFSWSIQCSLKFKQKIVSGHFYSHTPGATLSLTMWVHRSSCGSGSRRWCRPDRCRTSSWRREPRSSERWKTPLERPPDLPGCSPWRREGTF